MAVDSLEDAMFVASGIAADAPTAMSRSGRTASDRLAGSGSMNVDLERRLAVVWRNHAETSEQAKARWKTGHPGKDLEAAGNNVMIIGWLPPVDEDVVSDSG
jgi:hypothetical protein